MVEKIKNGIISLSLGVLQTLLVNRRQTWTGQFRGIIGMRCWEISAVTGKDSLNWVETNVYGETDDKNNG